jgi:hypothetical protein
MLVEKARPRGRSILQNLYSRVLIHQGAENKVEVVSRRRSSKSLSWRWRGDDSEATKAEDSLGM